ncbi:hypothetical protein [Saccharothrix sp. CB00851]|uniref:hypothetical protein n=1 Tax=Saccharothrix sp. CB00851 TaxID=1835005 RepID=UPI0011610B9F|nr:hypothetical protein [Saccharothrix sp. CB00851]
MEVVSPGGVAVEPGTVVLVVVVVGTGARSGIVVVVVGVVDTGDEAVPSGELVAGWGSTDLLVLISGPGGPAGPLSVGSGGRLRAKATTTATTAVPVPAAATA